MWPPGATCISRSENCRRTRLSECIEAVACSRERPHVSSRRCVPTQSAVSLLRTLCSVCRAHTAQHSVSVSVGAQHSTHSLARACSMRHTWGARGREREHTHPVFDFVYRLRLYTHRETAPDRLTPFLTNIYIFTRCRGANTAHTNGTAYTRGTYSRVHTQMYTVFCQCVLCQATSWGRAGVESHDKP